MNPNHEISALFLPKQKIHRTMSYSATPYTKEQYSSHIPALVTMMKMGWEFLKPDECMSYRDNNRDVLLKPVLINRLENYRFQYKGKSRSLSDNAIQQVVSELSNPGLNEGLLPANERIYDKLTLGITVTEFIDGKKYQPTIPLIDWNNPENNQFHITEEFVVRSSHGIETRRPDLVAFVNGIPLVVIEAKRPDSNSANNSTVNEGISQTLRNQRNDEIPQLFAYAQLLLAINQIEARYGTTNTPKEFWTNWKEEQIDEAEMDRIKNSTLTEENRNKLFSDRSTGSVKYFTELWSKPQLVTEQDRLLICQLRPDRLLEFVRVFILFDRKRGKIAARYPQAFSVKALLERVALRRGDGGREGGVIWHTTGSGKSFTMVFLCKALLLTRELKNCRIIVVTDRVDLEKQLSKTFQTGGAFGGQIAGKKQGDSLAKVKSGKDLALRIGKGNERIIFTIINKFATATKLPECRNTSENIIVLVDEGHRSHGGETHERMRQALPNAAYIAFTGTPLLKGDKTTNKFGPIVHAYSMKRAVEDGTVTPLLYEERKPQLDVNANFIDQWFEKITKGLAEKQKSDLKKKFANKGAITLNMSLIDYLIVNRENFESVCNPYENYEADREGLRRLTQITKDWRQHSLKNRKQAKWHQTNDSVKHSF